MAPVDPDIAIPAFLKRDNHAQPEGEKVMSEPEETIVTNSDYIDSLSEEKLIEMIKNMTAQRDKLMEAIPRFKKALQDKIKSM